MTYTPDSGYYIVTPLATYFYSTAGIIQSVKTTGGGGTTLQFSYPTANSSLPTKVTNAAGQSLTFAYNSDSYVSSVTDTAGNVWSYGYTNVNLLTSVTSPGSPADVRTYFYESPDIDYSLLTGIAINGTRYSTYEYGTDKRVTVSSLAGGEVRDTFVYGSNTTTMTDAKGQSTTYNFTPAQGALKVSSISRAGTSTCAAASATTVYDVNGWVDYTLDWNGVKDDYTYDAAGRLLQLTSRADTPAASTRVNTWSGENLATATFSDAGGNAFKSVAYTYFTTGFATDWLQSETWTDLRLGGTRQTSYDYAFGTNGVLSTKTVTETLPSDTAVMTYQYDAVGNVASITGPTGQQTTYSAYNGLGLPGRVVAPNGFATDLTYDAKSNLVSSVEYVNGGTRTTNYAYNNARLPTDIYFPTGAAQRFRYNDALRLEYTGNAASEFVHSAYDTPSNTGTVSSSRICRAGTGRRRPRMQQGRFRRSPNSTALAAPMLSAATTGSRWVTGTTAMATC